MTRYRAAWIYQGNSPPVADATIEIHDGLIQEVDTEGSADIDLGQVALLPGLINCHTHLEFSAIQTPLEPRRNFAGWIQTVIKSRYQNEAPVEHSVASGLQESIRAGVCTVGEIATTDWRHTSLPQISESSLIPDVLMFREFLGLSDDAVERQVATARDFLEAPSVQHFQAGLSPHAPYSLHPELFVKLCDLAEEFRVPIAVHLSESPAEIELLERGTGPLREMLTDMKLFRSDLFPGGRSVMEFLERLDCTVPALIVHGNYLTSEELEFLRKRPQMSVVYCPRTHAAMQTNSHPWQLMLELGINVSLGTDSRASNPDLSIWNELVFLQHQNRRIPASELLKLATVNGAKALKLQDLGTLTPGAIANLCVVPLAGESLKEPETHLFSPRHSPAGTMIRGDWAIRPGSLRTV